MWRITSRAFLCFLLVLMLVATLAGCGVGQEGAEENGEAEQPEGGAEAPAENGEAEQPEGGAEAPAEGGAAE